MRPLIFLFPHDRMDVGGNTAQVRFMEACASFCSASRAFYGQRIPGEPFLDDILASSHHPGGQDRPIFVIHWGPDIADLVKRLEGQDIVYFAHSTGWGMALPPSVPILCVSRNTMAFWGRHSPNAYIALAPNIVDGGHNGPAAARDVDVLVQARKSSRYLLDRLVPALRPHCRVTLLDGWVDDLGAWFDRSKVYLYDSLEHWIDVGATEGFGLPPLEAMGRGCVVFSGLNDALADYLDPGFNCRKIRVHSLGWDVRSILSAVRHCEPPPPPPQWFGTYSQPSVTARLRRIFDDLEGFFAFASSRPGDIEDVWARRKPGPLQRAKSAAKILAGVS